ncbi:hypothetical protein L2719_20085 [Shewanella schlegeliana]|uniref:Uncharacterized protein n=1 Tax=Shewanella schlegeliana TaxID=190308 RepID=A0ABS1T1X3_9GAMM|nr:hypothetical protein [Shewanella schlegeliana]MBL4914786.1 hypothetical protein [Shewanella schlegeliana]MCL1111826.1 hypothetical protein [Shewanella schlegeliana]GIU38272.1 hypothetical protein TUM4433_39690 [Shewanella schlegeliana]
MLVVTNYPNVPIATSNAATDSARTDGQQRPPIIPPQQATKGHEERAFNPQHERTAEHAQSQAKLRESVQQKQQGHSQQQEQSGQEKQKQAAALNLKQLLSQRGPLKRSDIKIPQQAVVSSDVKSENKQTMPNEPLQFYQAFGVRIEAFYHQRTEPNNPPAFLGTA